MVNGPVLALIPAYDLVTTIATHTTAWLLLGLLLSYYRFKEHAGISHGVLLVASIGAVASPAMAILAQSNNWGMLSVISSSGTMTELPFSDRSFPGSDQPSRLGQANVLAPQQTDREVMISPGPIRHSKHRILQFRVVEVLVVAWGLVSSVMFFRLLGSVLLGAAVLRTGVPIVNAEHQRTARVAAELLGITGNYECRESSHIDTPIIWCWSAVPVVLIPSTRASECDYKTWLGIYCHEFAHWLRRDHWSGLFSELLVVILPWHPLSWIVRARLSLLQEVACDDWVVLATKDAMAFAESLMTCAQSCSRRPVLPAITSQRRIYLRLTRLLSWHDASRDPYVSGSWRLTSIGVLVVAIAGIALAQPSSKESTTIAASALMPLRDDAVLAEVQKELQTCPAYRSLDSIAAAQIALDYLVESTTLSGEETWKKEVIVAIQEIKSDSTLPSKAEEIAFRIGKNPAIVPSALGSVYAEVAKQHGRHGKLRGAITWSQAALRRPISGFQRLEMYLCWAKAARAKDLRDLNPTDQSLPWRMVPALLGAIDSGQYRIPDGGFRIISTQSPSLAERDVEISRWLNTRLALLSDIRDELVILSSPYSEIQGAIKQLSTLGNSAPADLRSKHSILWQTGGYASVTNVPVSGEVIGSMAECMADVVTQKGLFRDVASSLRNNRKGPQIDVAKDVFDQLGPTATVIVDYRDRANLIDERFAVCFQVGNISRIKEIVERLADGIEGSGRKEVGLFSMWTTYVPIKIAVGILEDQIVLTQEFDFCKDLLELARTNAEDL